MRFSFVVVFGLALGWSNLACLAADDPAADLKALAGEWKRVRQLNSGEEETIEAGETLRIRIRDDKVTLWRENERLGDGELKFKLTTTTKPKLIDFTLPDGQEVEGIYELTGKAWRLCLSSDPDVRERPDVFESKTGEKRVLLVLEKVAD